MLHPVYDVHAITCHVTLPLPCPDCFGIFGFWPAAATAEIKAKFIVGGSVVRLVFGGGSLFGVPFLNVLVVHASKIRNCCVNQTDNSGELLKGPPK